MKQDLDRLEAGIRMAAATKRIEELERQVGALQATPEKIDLELLTNRVLALEAKVSGNPVDVSAAPVGATSAARASSPAPSIERKDVSARRKPALKLPELETRPRLATSNEIKDFARGN